MDIDNGILKEFDILPKKDVIVNEKGTWRFIFKIGKKGIRKGGKIVIYITETLFYPRKAWSVPQILFYNQEGYTTALLNRKNKAFVLYSSVEHKNFSDGNKKKINTKVIYQCINFKPLQNLIENDEIIITYGDSKLSKNGLAVVQKFPYNDYYFGVELYPDGITKPIYLKHNIKFNVLPGKLEHIRAIAPSTTTKDEKFDLCVSGYDEFDNPVKYNNPIKVKCTDPESTYKNISSKNNTVLVKNCNLRTINTIGVIPPKINENKINVNYFSIWDKRAKITKLSNPIWFNKDDGNIRILWGHLHCHSYSSVDADNDIDYVTDFARDVLRFDFFAFGDHFGVSLEDEAENWDRAIAWAENNNKEGKFTTFLGYECGDQSFKHANMIYLEDREPLICKKFIYDPYKKRFSEKIIRLDENNPDERLEQFRKFNGIVIKHQLGGVSAGCNWKYLKDFTKKLYPSLVEIYSKWGSGEFLKDSNSPYWDSQCKEHLFRSALENGFILGVIGGGDPHSSLPGLAMSEPKDSALHPDGLTAVYSVRNDRKSIFDALNNRSCYATNGERINLDFKINDARMGGCINSGDKRTILVQVAGTSKLKHIIIVKNGEEYIIHNCANIVEGICCNDYASYRKMDYYYVKVIQDDNGVAWSSPIWVENQ